jgi:uncharacterized glyoxalase superfamily protein PhnB
MPDAPATLATTKLVVHEIDAMATFYCEAYGFEPTGRMQAEIAGEPIDEIFLGRPGAAQGSAGSLILLKYLERPAPPTGEVLLVFTTSDIDTLFERVGAAGGRVEVPPFQSDVTPYKAGFTSDPEGHWIENVEIRS